MSVEEMNMFAGVNEGELHLGWSNYDRDYIALE